MPAVHTCWLSGMLFSRQQSLKLPSFGLESSRINRIVAGGTYRAGKLWRCLPVLIFLIAFGLRVAHLVVFRRTVLFDVPVFDEAFYHEHAQAIAAGDWGGRDAFFMGPLYSYFLGLLYIAFRGSRFLALLAQSAIGSLTCVLAYFIGRRLFSDKIGVAAAAVCSAYGILIFYDGFLLMETLVLFLNMLCVLLVVKAVEARRHALFFAAGVPLGLSALGRASVLTFVIGVAIWLYWGLGGSRRFRAACLSAFALGMLLVITPVSFRNYLTEGDLVIVSGNGGLNFYIGNGPGATGTFRMIEDQAPSPGDITGRFLAQEAEGRKLTLAEVSDWWYSEAWSYIRDKPWAFLKNWAWKIRLFWSSLEIPQLEWYEAAREGDAVLSLPLVSSRLIIPLALIGFVLSVRRFRKAGIHEKSSF